MVVARDWGRGGWGVTAQWAQEFPFGVIKCFGTKGSGCTTL